MAEVLSTIDWHNIRLSHSKLEWLKEIPVHWDVTRLRYLASEPLAYGANEAALEDNPSFPRFIRITDINEDGSLRAETFKSLKPEVAEPYLLDEGDILLARSGATVGKAFIYRKEWGKACFAGYLIRFRCDRDLVTPDFLYVFTHCDVYWSQVREGTIQATIQNFSAEKYGEILIPLPPLSEQRSITRYLDRQTAKLDTLIKLKQRLLELLAEKRRALITHAVTRGLDPNVTLRNSGLEFLGRIPSHWEVINLKFLGQVRSGVAKGRQLGARESVCVPYLRVANVQDGYLDLSDVATIEVLPEEISTFSLKRGDVLMNEGGDADKLGRGAIWDGSIDPCLHQNHVFAVRCFNVEPTWLTTVTSSDYAKAYFESRSKQSTNLASISSTNVQELPIVMPPQQEQNAIMEYLKMATTKLDRLREITERTLALLQERRTALIATAVTGQIRVTA